MKLTRCPVCHSNVHLDALVNDDAAREMLTLLAPLDGGLGRALVAYIGLFRPAKSDLSFSRALKLAHETLSLASNKDYLRAGLEQTIMQLRAARQNGQSRPLTNHNYLKKVIESLSESAIVAVQHERKTAKPSLEIKSYSAPQSLEQTKAEFEARMASWRK